MAHYFHSATHWDSAWYNTDDPRPPFADTVQPAASCASWQWRGTTKTLSGCMLFPDLTFCWYKVVFDMNRNADPNDSRAVQRSARYLPRPSAWEKEALVDAHETYGETVAGFAESYEGTGQYCARGECWDLANEALKYFEQFDYIPRPLTSISRTHGHLIFEGKATGRGISNQVGRWRGGDDRVRRGDIVQWLSAKVSMGKFGGHTTLGDPDHTAVIVSDSVPSVEVADGEFVKPAHVGVLEVVEQGVGNPPKRVKYDLSLFEAGEVWIYRPVGIEAYLGTPLVAECPGNVNALSVE